MEFIELLDPMEIQLTENGELFFEGGIHTIDGFNEITVGREFIFAKNPDYLIPLYVQHLENYLDRIKEECAFLSNALSNMQDTDYVNDSKQKHPDKWI